MKRWLTWVVVCLMTTTTFAQHTLDYLFMDVVLDTNGDAYVQEMRSMDVGGSGTECYITFNNLPDGMELRDLSVKDGATVYAFEQYWNTERTRSQKASRCGFHKTDEGIEVCWGLGDVGRHNYIVRYVISNLVRSYEESDGFNHSFYEASYPAARTAYVNIRALHRDDALSYTSADIWDLPCFQATTPLEWTELNLSELNVDSTLVDEAPKLLAKNTGKLQLDSLYYPAAKAWAFGYDGYLLFSPDGAIRAENDSTRMSQGESIIVMAEFEKGMFKPAMEGDVDKFETVKERAFFNSDYSLDDESDGTWQRSSFYGGDSDTPLWVNYLAMILVVLLLAGLVLLPIWGICYGIVRLIWGKKIDQRKWNKKLSRLIGEKVDTLPYHRDPPMNGRLTCSQRILTSMRPKNPLGISQLIEAFMLRMLYKGIIQLSTEKDAKGKVREVFLISAPEKPRDTNESDDHKDIIHLYNPYMQQYIQERESKLQTPIDDVHLEYQLNRLLYLAAGKDHLLQPDELKKFIEDHALSIRPYARLVDYMVNATVPLDNLPKEGAKEVYGFFKFLNDFTLVNERELSEVSLWKEYLVFASLYGMAKEVRKGMQKVAPDVMKLDKITGMLLATGASGVLVGSLIDTMNNSYRYVKNFRTAEEIRAAKVAAMEAAERAARERRYSGGGGHSSHHGGGGHSGGGGSGVR